jgi:uncharacterized membrane protein
MGGKSLWKSKTLWVNVVAMVAMIVQAVTGKDIVNIEIQAGILAFVNVILRLVTKEPIEWK